MTDTTAGAALRAQRFTVTQIALLLTLAFGVLRLVLCGFVGMGTNEAYAVASGRLWSLSYFDHPPLHFWLAQLSAAVFGDARWARLPFIALGTGSAWLVYALTRRLFGAQAGLWASLAFNLSLFFSIVAGSWILPDGPLDFFLLAAASVMAPLAQKQNPGTERWIAAGLLVGLGAISKYHALIFAACAFGFLISTAHGRKILRTPGPWLAVGLVAIMFTPVLIWNAQHDWISFRFQGGRANSHHFGGGLFLSLLMAQLALLTPWVAWPLMRGTLAARPREDEGARYLLWLGLPMALFFSLVPLWSDDGMVQWAMPGWLMLLPLAGRYLASRPRGARNWAAISIAIFGAVMVLGMIEFQTAWMGDAFPRLFRRGDPTAENSEWKDLGAVVPPGLHGIVLSTDWRDAAKIDQALEGSYRVEAMSNDPRNFGIGRDFARWRGGDGWIVARDSARTRATLLAKCFTKTAFVSQVTIARGLRPDVV